MQTKTEIKNSGGLYERPRYYAASHLFFGFIAVWFPLVGILALVYQLGQYVFNIRAFPVEGRIEPGNSWQHTGLKLFEMAVGYLAGTLVHRLY
jgi:hypothetical protein